MHLPAQQQQQQQQQQSALKEQSTDIVPIAVAWCMPREKHLLSTLAVRQASNASCQGGHTSSVFLITVDYSKV